MKRKNLRAIVKGIIQDNQYLSLATSDRKGKAWVSPVYYCCDSNYNFYYASQVSSVHSKNIFKNPTVAYAIFDSTAPEGTGIGVQIAGKARIVQDKELAQALPYYHSQFVTPEMLTEKGPYKIFKIIPQKIFIQDPDAKVDKRVAVKL